MADIKHLIPHILRWEGGYVNDPDDLGGATNRGVTLATYAEYCRRKGIPSPSVSQLKALPMPQWADILKTMYWDRWRGDEIKNQSVADMLVDWVWGSGKYGITIPQRLLGVAADGIVGPKTIAAVNATNPSTLWARLKQARSDYYHRICVQRPQNRKYLRGWLNRLNSLRFEP